MEKGLKANSIHWKMDLVAAFVSAFDSTERTSSFSGCLNIFNISTLYTRTPNLIRYKPTKWASTQSEWRQAFVFKKGQDQHELSFKKADLKEILYVLYTLKWSGKPRDVWRLREGNRG